MILDPDEIRAFIDNAAAAEVVGGWVACNKKSFGQYGWGYACLHSDLSVQHCARQHCGHKWDSEQAANEALWELAKSSAYHAEWRLESSRYKRFLDCASAVSSTRNPSNQHAKWFVTNLNVFDEYDKRALYLMYDGSVALGLRRYEPKPGCIFSTRELAEGALAAARSAAE